jgi:hypothetical protein
MFFNRCNTEITKDSLCGTWYNEEEKTKITLGCDGSFTAIDIPDDIDNCFFNYREKNIRGNWNKLGSDQIKLTFGDGSYCILEIVHDNKVNLRMRTKIDSNVIIDLSLQK